MTHRIVVKGVRETKYTRTKVQGAHGALVIIIIILRPCQMRRIMLADLPTQCKSLSSTNKLFSYIVELVNHRHL